MIGSSKQWFLLLVLILCSFAMYLFQWLKKREQERRQRVSAFLDQARVHFTKSQIPSQLITQHLQIRESLYKEYGNSEQMDLADADDEIMNNEMFNQSWQRRLPPKAKELLRGAVLRRLVATIPIYHSARENLRLKSLLFSRNLLAEYHMQAIQDEFAELCLQLKLLIHDARCMETEEKDGSCKLLSAASALAHAQQQKKNEESENAKIKELPGKSTTAKTNSQSTQANKQAGKS